MANNNPKLIDSFLSKNQIKANRETIIRFPKIVWNAKINIDGLKYKTAENAINIEIMVIKIALFFGK